MPQASSDLTWNRIQVPFTTPANVDTLRLELRIQGQADKLARYDDVKIIENYGARYYADVDGDGYGDPAAVVTACSQPVNYVIDWSDCDDTDRYEKPGQTWYLDSDGDGYSDGTSQTACTRPANYFAAGELAADSQTNLLTNGLVAHYDFENSITDSSTKGNDLTGGTPVYETTDKSTVLNNRALTASDDASLDITDNMTISFWMKPESDIVGYATQPVSKWSSTANSNVAFYYFGTTSGINRQIRFYANA